MSARQLARLRALVEEKRRKEEEAQQLAKGEVEEEEEEEEYRPSVSFSVKMVYSHQYQALTFSDDDDTSEEESEEVEDESEEEPAQVVKEEKRVITPEEKEADDMAYLDMLLKENKTDSSRFVPKETVDEEYVDIGQILSINTKQVVIGVCYCRKLNDTRESKLKFGNGDAEEEGGHGQRTYQRRLHRMMMQQCHFSPFMLALDFRRFLFHPVRSS